MLSLKLSMLCMVFSFTACNPNQASSSTTPTVDHASTSAAQHEAMHGSANSAIQSGDTAFRSMQERGKMAMGVDQYTSAHQFDLTPGGGRIQLQRASDDSLGVAQIRAHMKLIQHAFQAGDFSTPAFVHARDMPGTATMSEKRTTITYTYADLPRGGEVRISSSDPAAIAAIHEFLAAQRKDHHASGMTM